MRIDKKKILRRVLATAAFLAAVPVAVLCLRPDLIRLVSRPKRGVAPETAPKDAGALRRRRRRAPERSFRSPTIAALENLEMAERMENSNGNIFLPPPFYPDAPEEEPPELRLPPEKPRFSWLPETAVPVFDPRRSFSERLDSVHSLGGNLNEDERDALYYFIASRPDDADNLVLKNDIMNALRDQRIPPPEFAETLIALFKDHSLGETTRDYIIQHLRPWYEDNPRDRHLILPVFFAALKESGGSIAGTALLALDSLSKEFPEVDAAKVAAAAADMAGSTTDSPLVRISAVQIAAELLDDPRAASAMNPETVERTVETIRNLAASDGDGSTALRVSAIAALGRVGAPDDAELLKRILLKDEKRYHPAARRALALIGGRGTGRR